MSVTLTDQDKSTLRTAAYGAVALMAAADATGKPGKVAAEGSVALTAATGVVGHVLAEYPKDSDLGGRSVADLADRVLPNLTAAMALLKKQDQAEADSYRTAVLVAVETAARATKGQPGPVLVDMNRKITEALDAA